MSATMRHETIHLNLYSTAIDLIISRNKKPSNGNK